MNTVAKYLRISNEDISKAEDAESFSIVNQRHLLDSYLDEHSEFDGWNRIEMCDDGWSGTNFERPGIKELLDLVKKGRVQCIIVKDLSRFGRNYLTVGDYISRVFPFMGVRFISLGDGYDSSRPSDVDSLSVTFSTIIYDLYSKELSEKVRLGRDRQAAKGDFFAPAAPYGYIKDPDDHKHLLVDPEASEIVKMIFDSICSGSSATEVARRLNKDAVLTPMQHKRRSGCKWLPWPCITEDNFWHGGMVTKIIRDERYTGCNIYGKRRRDIVGSQHTVKEPRDKWIIVRDTHEAIISEEQFRAAQRMIRVFRVGAPTNAKKPLARKVYCGCCGRAMRYIRARESYYDCETYRYTEEYECSGEHFPESDILEATLMTIRTYARLAVNIDQLLQQKQAQSKADRKQLQRRLMVLQSKKDQIERRLQEMYEMFVEGNIEKSEYISRKQNLSDQLTQISEDIDALETTLSEPQTSETSEILSRYKSYAEIDELTESNIRDLLDRVTLYPNGVIHIRLNFSDELEEIARNFNLTQASN